MPYMSPEQINEVLLDYVKDERNRRAVLLNGPWGSGKSHFIKNVFCRELEKMSDYKVIFLSLYGMSSEEEIRKEVNLKISQIFIDNCLEKSLSNAFQFGRRILHKRQPDKQEENKNSSRISDISRNILTRALAASRDITVVKKIDENIPGLYKEFSRTKWVLIFDDFERSNMEPVPLMGAVNNYVENDGYRVIIIADETQVFHSLNFRAGDIANEYQVALSHDIQWPKDYAGTKLANQPIDKAILEKRADWPFNDRDFYFKTKEKLIGITIRFSPDIVTSYESIIQDNVKEQYVRDYLLGNKEAVIKTFLRYEICNLRTLIFVCVVLDRILPCFEEIEDKYRVQETDDAVQQVILNAVQRSGGENRNFTDFWNGKEQRYDFSISPFELRGVPRYRFIDEFFETRFLDKKQAHKDITQRVSHIKANGKDFESKEKSKELALYQLSDWYYKEDETVDRLVKKLKAELEERKYRPAGFKDILLVLLQINDPEYGLHPLEVWRREVVTRKIYVSEDIYNLWRQSGEHDRGKDIGVNAQQSCNKNPYETYEISEYVDLMVDFLTDENIPERDRFITFEMLHAISTDKKFLSDYVTHAWRLYDIARNQKEESARQKEKGGLGGKPCFNQNFLSEIIQNKEVYFQKGFFLSVFQTGLLMESIADSTPKELDNLRSALEVVYSGSNSLDIFRGDIAVLEEMKKTIDNELLAKNDLKRSRKIFLTQLSDMVKDVLGRRSS